MRKSVAMGPILSIIESGLSGLPTSYCGHLDFLLLTRNDRTFYPRVQVS